MLNISEYGGLKRAKGNSGIERIGKVIGSLNLSLPVSEFGQVFTGFYHKGKKAIEKLLEEKQGQITGAFYRKDIGDIDLVWGKVTNAKQHKGFGLAHIVDKHPNFDVYLISKIVRYGKVEERHKGFTVKYKKYKLGIKDGYEVGGNKISKNRWIVTSFEED